METGTLERVAEMAQPISDYKILSFYHEAKTLAKDGMVAPRLVSMWLSNCCNLKCSGCWWMAAHKASADRADAELVKKLVDELVSLGTESIEFSGGGESTLHPDFCSMAKYVKSKGVSVGVLTNGTVLNKGYLEKSDCQIGTFSYIRTSLDYSNPKSYLAGKGVDLFETVVGNAKSLIDMRGIELCPKIGFKFLLNTKNISEMADMVSLSESVGVDYAQFKFEHSSGNMVDDRQTRYADMQVRALRKKADIPVYGILKRAPCNVRCFMSPIHAVVDCFGNVYTCCHFSDERGLIGNAFEEGFVNLWFSEKHREVMNKLSPGMCERESGGGCRWFGYNEIMDRVINRHDGDLEFI